jgi:hypothetical protein
LFSSAKFSSTIFQKVGGHGAPDPGLAAVACGPLHWPAPAEPRFASPPTIPRRPEVPRPAQVAYHSTMRRRPVRADRRGSLFQETCMKARLEKIAHTSLARSLRRAAPMALLFLIAASSGVEALEFKLTGTTALASGVVEKGDVQKFSTFIATLPRDSMGNVNVTLSLDSSSGDLLEGISLGEAIRKAKIATLVASGRACHAACALAFLGGTFPGATGDGVSRQLEPGAQLGLDGFALGADDAKLVSDKTEQARVADAIVLDYASRMGRIDVGFVVRLLNAPPAQDRLARTPEAIRALGVELAGSPLKLPQGWSLYACQNAIRGDLNPLYPGDAEERVDPTAVAMKDVADFRAQLLDDKYPADDNGALPLRNVISPLPAAEAIDLLSGQAMGIDGASGKMAVYRRATNPG